jgi:hypothetical protein
LHFTSVTFRFSFHPEIRRSPLACRSGCISDVHLCLRRCRLVQDSFACRNPAVVAGLFKLAVVQLFASQALPSSGLSGTMIVAKGLARRGVARSLVMTALLVDGFSYYASYLMVGLFAFVILWHSGNPSAAWLPLRRLLSSFFCRWWSPPSF